MEKRENMLEVQDLSVTFDSGCNKIQVLNHIGFHIDQGEALGVVGESGCGKSMTAMAIMGLIPTPPAQIRGKILFEGRDLLSLKGKEMRSIRGNRISMIFQEPMTSLNPVLTVGSQLEEAFRIHQKVSGKKVRELTVEALRSVGVADPEQRVREYPHQMSGGMRQRVMIAMAMVYRPRLLIADEPTTALDVTIQAQVLELMKKLKEETGTAILFVSHDLGVIAQMCSRVLVFYCGEIVEEAPVRELLNKPEHPYTRGLLAALPRKGVEGDLYVIEGTVPPASRFPRGCVFAPRCRHAEARCFDKKPPMTETGKAHRTKCFLYEKEKGEKTDA